MKLGLLWYDADQRVSPQQRLAEAATRFAERFGRPANCCHVHPEELFADPAISVVADPTILKHHFWVGRDEALEPERPRRTRKAVAPSTPPEAPPIADAAVLPPVAEPLAILASTPDAPVETSVETLADAPGPVVVEAPSSPPEKRRRRSASRSLATHTPLID